MLEKLVELILKYIKYYQEGHEYLICSLVTVNKFYLDTAQHSSNSNHSLFFHAITKLERLENIANYSHISTLLNTNPTLEVWFETGSTALNQLLYTIQQQLAVAD